MRPASVCRITALACALALASRTPGRAQGAGAVPARASYPFAFADGTAGDYLDELRVSARLDTVTAGAISDLERVRAVSAWTHRRCGGAAGDFGVLDLLSEPTGVRSPGAAAPEAVACTSAEYATIARDALVALGISARAVEIGPPKGSAGALPEPYVLAEAYLRDAGKWVVFDPRADVAPLLRGIPLNAHEFGEALVQHPYAVTLTAAAGDVAGERRRDYLNFVGARLRHLSTDFDQRPGPRPDGVITHGIHRGLYLAPADGTAEAQGPRPADLVYTARPQRFYPTPPRITSPGPGRPATTE